MSTNPYESPETVGYAPPRKSFWPNLLTLLVVIGIIGLLVALLLPAQRGVRESARRMQCQNHLRQIALALRTYEETYKCLPPAWTVDAAGKPVHSWRTLILPYLDADAKALYDRIDLSKPWDDPANKAAGESMPRAYRCPSTDARASGTTYLAIVASGGCFLPAKPRARAEITDALYLTLAVIEVPPEYAVPWMSPTDASEEMVLSLTTATRLPHPTGVQAACVAGNVMFLNKNTDPKALRALITIAGNDNMAAEAH
jgi:type II secretory pathway pseudopilin PulG